MREGASILLTAAVTMVVATALLWPAGLNAVDQQPPLQVAKPMLNVGNLHFTLEAPAVTAEEGATPSVLVKVANSGASTEEATIWLVVSATSPESDMSRRGSVPRTIWTHPVSVAVASQLDQTLTVVIEEPLPKGESIMVRMVDKQPVVKPAAAASQGAAQANAATVQQAAGEQMNQRVAQSQAR
jgi:hypothetical protein